MSRRASTFSSPNKLATRHGLRGPTKQGRQRELGTPSLAPALAHLPLANEGSHVALLADHVDRPLAQHAIGVAVGDAVHEKRHWQHRGAGRFHNWVVPVGTEQGAILARSSLNGTVAESLARCG